MQTFKLTAILLLLMAASACKKSKTSQPAALSVQTQVKATGISETLNAVYFITDQVGFVGGVNGGIYTTINGGNTWTAQASGATTAIRGFCFINANTGFAVGGESACVGSGCIPPGGYILRTTNAGQTWTKLNIADPTLISSVYFASANVGYCVSYNVIYKTTDGGTNWTATPFANLGTIITDIQFTDPQHGFVTCLSNKIIRTTDGGANWQLSTLELSSGYSAIAAGDGYMYIAGQQKVIKSTDGGANWKVLGNSYPNIFFLQFLDAQKGIGIGWGDYSGGDFGTFRPGIYATADGGNTWSARTSITEFGEVRGISFPYKNFGYAISNNALIKITID